MSDPFIEYVNKWDAIVAQIEELNKQLKPLKAKEMEMRKAIADSIGKAQPLKEGVNKFPLTDGRVLKLTQKIDRKIEEPAIEVTRELFEHQNDTNGVTFDDLLRVKYEISKRDLDKLPEPAAKVVSRMITSKEAAPELMFD